MRKITKKTQRSYEPKFPDHHEPEAEETTVAAVAEPNEPIVAEATKADVKKAAGEKPELVAGEKERIFECPSGHTYTGRDDADTVWCSTCQMKANPRR